MLGDWTPKQRMKGELEYVVEEGFVTLQNLPKSLQGDRHGGGPKAESSVHLPGETSTASLQGNVVYGSKQKKNIGTIKEREKT